MKNSKVHLQYLGTCMVNGNIWFLNLGFNSIFSLNLRDYSIECKHRTSFLDDQPQGAYTDQCCSYGNKLFFFPTQEKRIIVYDIQKDSIQEIPISLTDDSELFITVGIVQWKEQAWVFPMKLKNGIFILDLNTLHLKKDLELCQVLREVEEIHSVIRITETEIAILSRNDTIIQLDIQSKQNIFIKHFEECINIWGIRHDGNNFWLLQNDSTDIYEWNQAEDKLIKYCLVETEWLTTAGGVPYSNMVFLNNQIIILPCRLKFIMKIDRETHSIIKAIDYPKDFRFLHNQFELMNAWLALSAFDVIDNKIFLHPMLGNMLLVYDVEKNHMEGVELLVTNKEVPFLEEILGEGVHIKDIFYEVEDGGELGTFLNIIRDKESRHNDKEIVKNVGTEIYYSARK